MNRAFLFAFLEREIQRAKRYGGKLAVMYMDLDNFKGVNDTLGHEAGDNLLAEMAERFKGLCRSTDVIARLGGDEFVYVFTDVADPQSIELKGEQVLQECAIDVELPNRASLTVSPSIGLSFYPQHGEDSTQLLSAADQAMYEAKRSGCKLAVYQSVPMVLESA